MAARRDRGHDRPAPDGPAPDDPGQEAARAGGRRAEVPSCGEQQVWLPFLRRQSLQQSQHPCVRRDCQGQRLIRRGLSTRLTRREPSIPLRRCHQATVRPHTGATPMIAPVVSERCSDRPVAADPAARTCGRSKGGAGRRDRLLEFGDPQLRGVRGAGQVQLAGVADGAVAVGVDPAGQGLAGGDDLVHGPAVQEGGRGGDRREVHDRDVVAGVGFGRDRPRGMNTDHGVAVGGIGVVGEGGAGRGQAGAGQPVDQVGEQGREDRGDVLGGVAGGGGDQLRDPHGGDGLDHNVVGGHVSLVFDGAEPRLHPGQPGGVGRDRRREFRSAQPQHAAQLVDADLLVDEGAHLREGEAEVFEGDDPVESGELAGVVEAVAAGRVDPGGPQQSDRVVVTQHSDRHEPAAGEVSDGEHDAYRCTA